MKSKKVHLGVKVIIISATLLAALIISGVSYAVVHYVDHHIHLGKA